MKIVVFKNGKKFTPNSPDYSAVLEIGEGENVERHKFVGWTNESEKGVEYITFKLKTEKPADIEPSPATPAKKEDEPHF